MMTGSYQMRIRPAENSTWKQGEISFTFYRMERGIIMVGEWIWQPTMVMYFMGSIQGLHGPQTEPRIIQTFTRKLCLAIILKQDPLITLNTPILSMMPLISNG